MLIKKKGLNHSPCCDKKERLKKSLTGSPLSEKTGNTSVTEAGNQWLPPKNTSEENWKIQESVVNERKVLSMRGKSEASPQKND